MNALGSRTAALAAALLAMSAMAEDAGKTAPPPSRDALRAAYDQGMASPATNGFAAAEAAFRLLFDNAAAAPELSGKAYMYLAEGCRTARYGTRDLEMAAALYGKALKHLTEAAGTRACLFGLGQAYLILGNKTGATECFEKYLNDPDPFTQNDTAKTLAQLMDLYIERGDAKLAAERASGLVEQLPAVDRANLVLVRGKLAELYHRTLKEPAKAGTQYLKLIESLRVGVSASVPSGAADQLGGAFLNLAGFYDQTGQREKISPLLREALRLCPMAWDTGRAVQMLVKTEKAAGRPIDETLQVLRAQLATNIAVAQVRDAVQPQMVDMLLKAGRHEAALREARVYYYTCPTQNLQAAIALVSMAFKAADTNLARVNRFLKYQKCGAAGEDGKAGTEDDLADVLKALPPSSDEPRDRIYREAFGLPGDDWQDWQRRSVLHMYLDEPAQALAALGKSFELAPPTEKDLQQVTDAITAFIVRCTRNAEGARAFVQYVMYGPAGEDGKPGTGDDLANPLPGIARALAYGGTGANEPAR